MTASNNWTRLHTHLGSKFAPSPAVKAHLIACDSELDEYGMSGYLPEAALKTHDASYTLKGLAHIAESMNQLNAVIYEETGNIGREGTNEAMFADTKALYQDLRAMVKRPLTDLEFLQASVADVLAHCDLGEKNFEKQRLKQAMRAAFTADANALFEVVARGFQHQRDTVDRILQSYDTTPTMREYLQATRDLADIGRIKAPLAELNLGAQGRSR